MPHGTAKKKKKEKEKVSTNTNKYLKFPAAWGIWKSICQSSVGQAPLYWVSTWGCLAAVFGLFFTQILAWPKAGKGGLTLRPGGDRERKWGSGVPQTPAGQPTHSAAVPATAGPGRWVHAGDGEKARWKLAVQPHPQETIWDQGHTGCKLWEGQWAAREGLVGVWSLTTW